MDSTSYIRNETAVKTVEQRNEELQLFEKCSVLMNGFVSSTGAKQMLKMLSTVSAHIWYRTQGTEKMGAATTTVN